MGVKDMTAQLQELGKGAAIELLRIKNPQLV